MATIADELLNDFADSGSDQGEIGQQHDELFADAGWASPQTNGKSEVSGANGDMELDGDEEGPGEADGYVGAVGNVEMEDAESEEEAKARVEQMQLASVRDVRSVASLMKTLEPVMEKIEYFKTLPPDKQTVNVGSIEDNPEYKLLTLSNTLSTNIDGEIVLVHKFVRDHYSVRFPELETLIQNPLEYAKTVAIIGNGPMENIRDISVSTDNILGQTLKQVLDGPSLMVVTVEATTTRGTPLSDSELETVRRACQMTINLDKAKKALTEYVQSRMTLFAPNLTNLVGSLTAAQFINYAGGISGLAKTPACNLAPLGSKKNTSTGLATNVGVRQQGFLYQSDIIREVPSDLKVQAMRIVSAKIVLAARVDMAHSSPFGEQGLEFYDQCEKRIAKLSEAPPNKGVRALPAPDDKPARKRGGRRARKVKEATAMTDLRKAQNRMTFGKEENEVGYGQGESTKGMGMIGQQDGGRIRAQQIDQRTRAKLSKKNAGWGAATPVGGTQSSIRGFGGGPGNLTSLKAAGLRPSGVGGMRTAIGGASGTASTIAFTPVQGLELVDPKMREERERKRQAEEDRWFKNGTFTNVGGKVDSEGFKLPAPPAKKARTDG